MATDGTYSASQTFTWTVNSPLSITNPGDQTNNEGDTVSVQIAASGGTLNYSATGLPSGLAVNPTSGLITGTVAVGAAAGNGYYPITLTVSDATASASTTFNWTITLPPPQPQVPMVSDQSYDDGENQELTPAAARNLVTQAVDFNGKPLVAQLVSVPANVASFSLQADGEFDLVPLSDSTGSITFTFNVTDGTLTSNTAMVTVLISSAPIGNRDSYTLSDYDSLTVSAAQGVLANDFNPAGGTLEAVLVSAPATGTLDFNADGSFSYTPDASLPPLTTPVTFTYQPFVRDTTNSGNVTTVTLFPQAALPTFALSSVEFTNALPVLHDGTATEYNPGWVWTARRTSNPLALVEKQTANIIAIWKIYGNVALIPQFFQTIITSAPKILKRGRTRMKVRKGGRYYLGTKDNQLDPGAAAY